MTSGYLHRLATTSEPYGTRTRRVLCGGRGGRAVALALPSVCAVSSSVRSAGGVCFVELAWSTSYVLAWGVRVIYIPRCALPESIAYLPNFC